MPCALRTGEARLSAKLGGLMRHR